MTRKYTNSLNKALFKLRRKFPNAAFVLVAAEYFEPGKGQLEMAHNLQSEEAALHLLDFIANAEPAEKAGFVVETPK
jgi:hypothetical protein